MLLNLVLLVVATTLAVVVGTACWSYFVYRYRRTSEKRIRIVDYYWLIVAGLVTLGWASLVIPSSELFITDPFLAIMTAIGPPVVLFFIIFGLPELLVSDAELKTHFEDDPDAESTSTEASDTPDSTAQPPTDDIPPDEAKEAAPSWQTSDLPNVLGAAFVGALGAFILGLILEPPVTITIGAGALVAMTLAYTANYPRFAATGGLYFWFAAGLFLFGTGSLPQAYFEDAYVTMLLFGTLAIAIVSLQEAGQLLLRKVFGDKADAIIAVYRTITATVGLILTFLAGEKLWRKASRYGGIGVGAPLFTLLDILGIELPAPLFFVDGVNAVIIGFVAVVTMAYFTLDTLYALWHVAKHGASAATTGAKKGLGAAQTAAETGREYADDRQSDS